jgi:acetylornithine deacetylase
MINRAADLLGQLIAHPTVSSDSNLTLITFLADRLDGLGARVHLQTNSDGRKANLFASLGPDIPGGIVLSGHTDVVPVDGQDWSSDPFAMRREDGNLYGRGTCDMKGFIAAALAKAPDYAALPLARPVHFAFTYDEEIGCLGAAALAQWLRGQDIQPAMAIIGEPTMMQVIEGHKGCCEYTTRFTGLAGHGSMPDRGVNAVEYAVRYITRLMELAQELKTRAPTDGRFDPPWTTINIGALRGGSAHNVIPQEAELEWEFRPVQSSDYDYIHREIGQYAQTLLPTMRAISPNADITTQIMGEVAGLEPAAINQARDITMALTGSNGAGVVPFATEAGIFAALGMSAVVCGPGSIEQAHKADEYLSLEQLQKCLDMLTGLETTLTSTGNACA